MDRLPSTLAVIDDKARAYEGAAMQCYGRTQSSSYLRLRRGP